MKTETGDCYLTTDEAAELLGVSRATVQRWLKRRVLTGHRLGSARMGWRVKLSDVERFMGGETPRDVQPDANYAEAEARDELMQASRQRTGPRRMT